MKRNICLIILLIFSTGILTSCYDRREVDELAYVMAIGVDKGESGNVRTTFQIAIPKGMGGGSESGGSGAGEKNAFVTVIEAPSLYSAINMANTYIDRQLNLSHAKVIVFSKEVAEEGLEPYMNSLVRGREIRPNIFMFISRGKAEDFIKAVKPNLEASVSKFYELSADNYLYTSFTGNTGFSNFYNQALSRYSQPVASLVGVNKFESAGDIDQSGSTAREKGEDHVAEGDYKAGDVPRFGELKAEFMGLAAFDGVKMVGELDGEETGYYLMSTGDYHTANWSFPDPLSKDKFVVLSIRQSRDPVQRVDITGEKPRIKLEIRVEGDILSIQSGTNYEDIKKLPVLENAVENYFKEGIVKFLDRTAKEFHSDICGFGRSVKSKFLTWKEWENYKWLGRYKDSDFEVMVDVKIRRPGLIVRTIPETSSMENGEVGQQ